MIKKIVFSVILILLLPLLIFNSVVIVDSFVHPNETPSFFGWKPFIVLSSSMEDKIKSGDLVFVKEENNFNIGDIIAFKYDNIVITHRIKEINKKNKKITFITKGDNNKSVDPFYVPIDKVEGKYKFKINGLGNIVLFIQTPIGLLILLFIPVSLFIIASFMERREDINEKKLLEEELNKVKKENSKLKDS